MGLQRGGFAVWTASDGAAALELYRQQRQHIQLVLLDVRMPGLDGPQTLAELRRLDADVACCFMSADTGSYTPDDLRRQGGLHLIAKPFRLEEVTTTLRGLLARRGVP